MATATLVRDLKVTLDTLFTPAEVWRAKIYSNGWKKPGLGTADVIEKATGAKLGVIGIASAEIYQGRPPRRGRLKRNGPRSRVRSVATC